jgi:hypothetical protein
LYGLREILRDVGTHRLGLWSLGRRHVGRFDSRNLEIRALLFNKKAQS